MIAPSSSWIPIPVVRFVSVSKSHENPLSKMDEKMNDLKAQNRLKIELGRAKKGKLLLKDREGRTKRNLSPKARKKICSRRCKDREIELNIRIGFEDRRPQKFAWAMDVDPSSRLSSITQSINLVRREKMKPGLTAQAETKWRTAAQEQVYGRRLLEAIRSTGGAPAGPRAVKEAADSALALTARGQSRWSRAILLGRCCPRRKLLLKAGGRIRRGRRQPRPSAPVPVPVPVPQQQVSTELRGKKVRDRLRVLGRLVPGCRKLSASGLLEEAADYVAALEMQVKTMRALTEALSAASLSAGATGEPGS
ncbi:hypothetical protein C4D60_Mb10t08280 [Musa balbisiana]|uniref:BHLH domain-containing protein n=1 Tax=Musa balbisiana TaxID=52838 RepID=A0A4S8IY21_MUSBA|nr:hypothetical protein C4D60_Mb10t08280 [Musa balbisiana]